MKRYELIGTLALALLVIVLPIYGLQEAGRMEQAQAAVGSRYVVTAADLYVEVCIDCHGAGGEGLLTMPALNNPSLAEADRDLLYRTIAHSPHGSAMDAWHREEGGILSDYQVESLVTLIQSGRWDEVTHLAEQRGYVEPALSEPEVELATMPGGAGENPHECAACHEDPTVHVGQFGLDCGRCHTLEAWIPARLTRHTFLLDHGDEGQVACQTCHTETYVATSCYECHDHDPAETEQFHLDEGMQEFADCAACHPTGAAGEGDKYRKLQMKQQSVHIQPLEQEITHSVADRSSGADQVHQGP